MPKNRNNKVNYDTCRKFRIGPRKGGQSALTASTAQLEAVVKNPDMNKYHSNARHALSMRGITI